MNEFLTAALNYAKENATGTAQTGTVIVKDGEIIARGASSGDDSSVRQALNAAGELAEKNADVYVTMEPDFENETDSAPCDAQSLVEAGVRSVSIGSLIEVFLELENHAFYKMNGIEFSICRDKKLSKSCVEHFQATGGKLIK